jgi:hypothetical protein
MMTRVARCIDNGGERGADSQDTNQIPQEIPRDEETRQAPSAKPDERESGHGNMMRVAGDGMRQTRNGKLGGNAGGAKRQALSEKHDEHGGSHVITTEELESTKSPARAARRDGHNLAHSL